MINETYSYIVCYIYVYLNVKEQNRCGTMNILERKNVQ